MPTILGHVLAFALIPVGVPSAGAIFAAFRPPASCAYDSATCVAVPLATGARVFDGSVFLSMAERWTFVFYRAPKQPSSARVAAWRRLHKLGAVYLGPSACALPARLDVTGELDQIVAGLLSAGGTSEMFTVQLLSEESEGRLEALYNAARNAEYEELIERAQAVIDELAREGAREKFTYAEVEENEADLARLRRWAGRIRWRDVFSAPRRKEAESVVSAAQERLDVFARIASERDSTSADEEVEEVRVDD